MCPVLTPWERRDGEDYQDPGRTYRGCHGGGSTSTRSGPSSGTHTHRGWGRRDWLREENCACGSSGCRRPTEWPAWPACLPAWPVCLPHSACPAPPRPAPPHLSRDTLLVAPQTLPQPMYSLWQMLSLNHHSMYVCHINKIVYVYSSCFLEYNFGMAKHIVRIYIYIIKWKCR